MTTRRRKAARLFLGSLLVVLVIAPIGLALHAVDVRNNRRDLNQSKLEALTAVANANTARTAAICLVQNVDARRLNKVITYFENIAKHQYPSAATDAFWDAVPRPPISKCPHLPSVKSSTKGSSP